MTPQRESLQAFAHVRRPGAWVVTALILAGGWLWLERWTPWLSLFAMLMMSHGMAFGLLAAMVGRTALGSSSLLIAALACSTVAGTLAAVIVRSLDGSLQRGPGEWAVDAACGASFASVLALTVILRGYASQRRRGREAERRGRELQQQSHLKQLAEMKLKALQAQIEPHFLYNTLANVQHLVRTDAAAADRMLGNLIAYLKTAVPRMDGAVSTVGEELARVEAYLAIMQVRMPQRLAYEVDVPREARGAPLPPLSLITLVENSVKHGLEPRSGRGHIRVSGRLCGDSVELVVADDGVGFGQEAGGGVGLTNLRERLVALHGARASLELAQAEGGGVEAILSIPVAPGAARAA